MELREGLDCHHGEAEQVIKECQVMEDGMPVMRMELMKTKREMLEERKLALRNVTKTARKEVMEERAQELAEEATAEEAAGG